MTKRKRDERGRDGSDFKNAKRTKLENPGNISSTSNHGRFTYRGEGVNGKDKSVQAARREARHRKKTLKRAQKQEQARITETKPVQSPVIDQDEQKVHHRKQKRQRDAVAQGSKNHAAKQETEAPLGERKETRPSYSKKSKEGRSEWKLSDAVGGQMLDIDPIFALEEESVSLRRQNGLC